MHLKDLLFLSGMVISSSVGAITLEERIFSSGVQNEQELNLDLYEEQIRTAKDRAQIGKEVTSKMEFISFNKINQDAFGIDPKPFKKEHGILNDLQSQRFENSYDAKNLDSVTPVSTYISLVKKGEPFTVIDFIPGKHGSDDHFVVQDLKKNLYEVRKKNFEAFFINDSVLVDPPRVFMNYQKISNKWKDAPRARFCMTLNNNTFEQNRKFIENAEDFDPKFQEIIKELDLKFKKALTKLTAHNKLKADGYTYSIQFSQQKRLCYGLYFDGNQSFLNTLYFLPKLAPGSWKF